MKKYGILAFPAGHSLSPVVHNAAFKAAGIDASYGVFEVDERDLAEFMKDAVHEPISGLSVSLPHKEMVMKHLNEIDEDARAIAAVNTVKNEGGFLCGYNTDHIGAMKALKESVGSLEGSRVVVLGAGGAARAICYGLKKAGAEVVVLNRHFEKAKKLADEFEIKCGSLEDEEKCDGDILVQATSIWTLHPDVDEEELDDFVPMNFVEKFETVMDIVYTPLMTPLLRRAEELEKNIITGEKMFLYQAAEQFEIWTGEEAPVGAMKDALGDVLDNSSFS